jgi:hypothetical protein
VGQVNAQPQTMLRMCRLETVQTVADDLHQTLVTKTALSHVDALSLRLSDKIRL